MTISTVQLGKNGITDNFIQMLNDHFKNHMNVRISVLKNAGHEKATVKKYAEEILDKLGKNFSARTLGFTIFIKKWKRDVR